MINRGELGCQGCVTYWSLPASATRAEVEGALGAAGVHVRVPPVEACVRLGYALKGLHGRDTLIRSLGRRAGYQVTGEHKRGSRNDYTPAYRVLVKDASEGRRGGDALEVLDAGWSQEYAVNQAYDAEATVLRPAESGAAFTAAVRELGGVSLRPGGGLYWLHETCLPNWEKLAQAVNACRVYILRHGHDEDSLRAVLDAARREVASALAEIEEEVAAGQVGPRALRARASDAERLISRCAGLEALLGASPSDLRTRAKRASDAAAVAALCAASA